MAKLIPSLPNPLEKYQAEVTAKPQSAEAHTNLGWGYYAQKQFSEAVREFLEALRLDSNSIDAYWGMGLAYKGLNNKPEAMAAFEKVVALAPRADDKSKALFLRQLAQAQHNQLNNGKWDVKWSSKS
jgi:tetratricopeptide (TPR) repeat protein